MQDEAVTAMQSSSFSQCHASVCGSLVTFC